MVSLFGSGIPLEFFTANSCCRSFAGTTSRQTPGPPVIGFEFFTATSRYRFPLLSPTTLNDNLIPPIFWSSAISWLYSAMTDRSWRDNQKEEIIVTKEHGCSTNDANSQWCSFWYFAGNVSNSTHYEQVIKYEKIVLFYRLCVKTIKCLLIWDC